MSHALLSISMNQRFLWAPLNRKDPWITGNYHGPLKASPILCHLKVWRAVRVTGQVDIQLDREAYWITRSNWAVVSEHKIDLAFVCVWRHFMHAWKSRKTKVFFMLVNIKYIYIFRKLLLYFNCSPAGILQLQLHTHHPEKQRTHQATDNVKASSRIIYSHKLCCPPEQSLDLNERPNMDLLRSLIACCLTLFTCSWQYDIISDNSLIFV